MNDISLKWCSDLAYVIGLISTDGSLSKDGRHINLTSKDIEQLNTFARILKLTNKIGVKFGSYANTKCYQIQFGSVKFYRFLMEVGLTPNKTKTIGSLKIPKRYFADFLRGHIDGDGCTYSYWDKRWKSSFMLYTHFMSASERHIIWIKNRIKKQYGLDGKVTSARSCYNLKFAKENSLKLLKLLYYDSDVSCLTRKRYKIDKALSIINAQAEVGKLVDPQP